MKYDYSRETVTVTCTDTGVEADGVIVGENQGQIRVDMSGALLTFRRIKPGVYVANNAGLEFVINL